MASLSYNIEAEIFQAFNSTSRYLDDLLHIDKPGREAQSVEHLTCKSEVLGSILGLATYFRFSFR